MTDPYAAYGGAVASMPSPTTPPATTPPPAADPYAAYGGSAAPPEHQPDQPTSGWRSLANDKIHIDPNDSTTVKTIKGVESVGAGIEDDLLDAAGGAARMAGKVARYVTPMGLSDIILGRKSPVVPPVVTNFIDSKKKEIEANNAENPGLNKTGNVIGSIAEFLSGEEALKGLSMADKLQKIAPALKMLEKFPKTARVLATAIRQGTIGTAQAGAHGADTLHAIETGLVTGGVGGAADAIVPAAYGAIKNLISRIRPETTEIAGQVIPRLASQVPGASPGASRAATIAQAPEIAAVQQEGGQQAVTNIAQRATKNALNRVNGTRATAPITDYSRMLAAPPDYQPFQFHIEGPPTIEGATSPEGGPTYYAGTVDQPNPNFQPMEGENVQQRRQQLGSTAETIPDQAFTGDPTTRTTNWQYTPPEAGAPGTNAIGGGRLVTSDPATAQSALSRLEDITNSRTFESLPAEQQAAITAQRDSLQQQLGMYHASDGAYPNFQPVDADAAMQHVTNFGEAADQVQASVKPIYQKLDAVSGGSFTALRNQMKVAQKIMFQPGSMDAYEKALASKTEAEQGIQDLFNRHSGDISRVELQSANSAWRDSVVLDNIHSAVEGAFKGAPQSIADTIGTRRLLRGDNLTSRLNALLKKTPQANIERVIGADGLQNLYRVANLLSKPETAIATQNVAKETARELVRRVGRGALIGGMLGHIVGHAELGAVAGASSEDAARYILRQAAINPRVGVLVDRAVRHQVNPKIFAPLIAATLAHDPAEQQQEETPQ